MNPGAGSGASAPINVRSVCCVQLVSTVYARQAAAVSLASKLSHLSEQTNKFTPRAP
jgi:hypothetical protein